ncbi:MAG: ComEC/Rec2 family competence protein, partial [Sediminibacterium sp.]
NALWQLNAITLSAQILTLPIILYYFHQFPNLFLFTNFIAVPLSGFILYGELLLLLVCKIPVLNLYTGKAVSFLIYQMNTIIERTARLPFSVIDHIQVSLFQTIILYISIGYFAWWLLAKKSIAFITGLGFFCIFIFAENTMLIQQSDQQKLIVYNIPKQKAIDVVDGNTCRLLGDISTIDLSFHIEPSRTLHGVQPGEPGSIFISDRLIAGEHKSVLIINKPVNPIPGLPRVPVDIIILSGNPKIYLNQLAGVFDCPQYVFDNTNPLWKIQYWKKDADSLHLRHHTISEQGAFEVEL